MNFTNHKKEKKTNFFFLNLKDRKNREINYLKKNLSSLIFFIFSLFSFLIFHFLLFYSFFFFSFSFSFLLFMFHKPKQNRKKQWKREMHTWCHVHNKVMVQQAMVEAQWCDGKRENVWNLKEGWASGKKKPTSRFGLV